MSLSPDKESAERLHRRRILVVRLLFVATLYVQLDAYGSDSWHVAIPATILGGVLIVLWVVLDAKARRIGSAGRAF